MGIMIYRDRHAGATAAATLLAAKLIEKPNAVMGIGAATELAPVFRNLIGMTAAGVTDWSEASVFHTAELMARKPGLTGALTNYLHKELYQHIGMELSRVHAPKHAPQQDMGAACIEYEETLVGSGGMDLLLMHLGRNGHIAFNGPAREFSPQTHVELLPQSTMEECSRMVGTDAMNAEAIAMGMGTVLSAGHIVLCAFGKEYAQHIERALGSITPAVPASMLQLHPNVTYIFDEDAAANL